MDYRTAVYEGIKKAPIQAIRKWFSVSPDQPFAACVNGAALLGLGLSDLHLVRRPNKQILVIEAFPELSSTVICPVCKADRRLGRGSIREKGGPRWRFNKSSFAESAPIPWCGSMRRFGYAQATT